MQNFRERSESLVDKFMTKLSKFGKDEDPFSAFEEACSATATLIPSQAQSQEKTQREQPQQQQQQQPTQKSKQTHILPPPPAFLLVPDTKKMLGDVHAGIHCPPRVEHMKLVDEIFTELIQADNQLESSFQIETQQTKIRAQELIEVAKQNNAKISKECEAIVGIAVSNCRIVIEDEPQQEKEKEKETQEKSASAAAAEKKKKSNNNNNKTSGSKKKVSLSRTWAENDEAIGAGLLKVEAEKKLWQDTVERMKALISLKNGGGAGEEEKKVK